MTLSTPASGAETVELTDQELAISDQVEIRGYVPDPRPYEYPATRLHQATVNVDHFKAGNYFGTPGHYTRPYVGTKSDQGAPVFNADGKQVAVVVGADRPWSPETTGGQSSASILSLLPWVIREARLS